MLVAEFNFLPWQIDLAKQWLSNKKRFAHAWLVHGMPGIGQEQFVIAAAASLLCEASIDGIACGQCQACNWVKEGNHPDLRRIRSEFRVQAEGYETDKKQVSSEIKIEQIRSLQPWFNTATHRGGMRVALLYMAEDLNPMAANALLKILEEPPANTVFLLAANSTNSLLPTIVSRCRKIALPKPATVDAIQWLESQGVQNAEIRLTAQGGSPISAYQMANEEPIPAWLSDLLNMLATQQLNGGDLADALANYSNTQWLDSAQRLCLDCLLSCFALEPYYYPGLAQKINNITNNADSNRILELNKWLIEMKPLANHPLNSKLLTDTAANKILQAFSA